MVEGAIKFFDNKKNFGFISGDDGKDYFVHRSGVAGGNPREGDRVTFDTEEGERGLKAVNVKVQ